MGACREMRLPRSESESQSMSPSAALDSLAAAAAPEDPRAQGGRARKHGGREDERGSETHSKASGFNFNTGPRRGLHERRRVNGLFNTLLPRVAPHKPFT